MTKHEFIESLKVKIGDLPLETQSDIIADYEEHFAAGLEDGKTEDEIAQKLGDPDTIAREFKNYSLIRKAEETKSPFNLSRAVLAVIGLSFFNLVFVVGPYFGILGTLIGLIITSVTLIGSGIAGVVMVIISPYTPSIDLGINPYAAAFMFLAVSSFGVFLSAVTYFLCKWFYILTIKYLKLNLNIIKK